MQQKLHCNAAVEQNRILKMYHLIVETTRMFMFGHNVNQDYAINLP